jgi:solute carrier family 25 iron transporter 28/37
MMLSPLWGLWQGRSQFQEDEKAVTRQPSLLKTKGPWWKVQHNMDAIGSSRTESLLSACGVGQKKKQLFVYFPHVEEFDHGSNGGDSLSFYHHMVAGAVAGVLEHVAMFPVDTAKTRIQAVTAHGVAQYNNVFTALPHIVRTEGVRRLYRGVSAVAVGAIPSHALYFATYEKLKDALGGNEEDHHAGIHTVCGGAATMVHDAIVTPLDVVKQRMQVANSQYDSVVTCVRDVMRNEGAVAFYRSYATTVVMNVPYYAVFFTVSANMKRVLEMKDSVQTDIVSGSVAGAFAGLASTPLDVVKTRIQTGNIPAREAVTSIYESMGLKGFTRGALARVLYFTPSAAICWSTFEAIKRVFKGEANNWS